MKKRICLIITMFISLFIFSNKVDAIYMYLECEYTNKCTEESNNISYRNCYPDYKYYIPLTDINGNVFYYVSTKEHTAINAKPFSKLDANCWLKEYTDDNCEKSETVKNKPTDIFYAGVCPSGIVNADLHLLTSPSDINKGAIPFGKDGIVKKRSDELTETKYIIYSFLDKNSNRHLIAEGYTEEGKYCYAGSDIKKNFFSTLYSGELGALDEIQIYVRSQAHNIGPNFWKVHTDFNTRLIAVNSNKVSAGDINVCAGLTETECKNSKYKYDIIIDSEDSNNNIKKAVENWYNNIINESEKLKPLSALLKKNNFIETSNKFNNAMSEGKKYNFSNSYTKEMFISDLNDAYEAINTAYGENNIITDYSTGKGTSPTSAIVSKIYEEYLGISEIRDIAEKDNKEYHVNINYIVTAIQRDVKEALEKHVQSNNVDIDIINIAENILEYMEMFYTSVAYLDRNSLIYELDTSQVSNVESLKEKFEDFVEENSLNFRPVIDCESLLGEELVAKINKYLDIFKIVIPILLIGLGIIDFTKAIFASDEDKMKKAKDTFIKRLFVAILIFISPLLVNLILNLANKVWSFISPSSCGFFE